MGAGLREEDVALGSEVLKGNSPCGVMGSELEDEARAAISLNCDSFLQSGPVHRGGHLLVKNQNYLNIEHIIVRGDSRGKL